MPMFDIFATCPAGLENAAARALLKSEPLVENVRTEGGSVIYSVKELRIPRCAAFQNAYYIAKRVRAENAQAAARMFAKDGMALSKLDNAIKALKLRTFRVMFSNGNELCAPDKQARDTIERRITGAKIDRLSPETEILITRRDNGFALLLLRLTRAKDTRKTLAKGALSESVCRCLLALAGDDLSGVLLDPFAGSGAIAKAILTQNPKARVLVNDIDENLANAIRASVTGAKVYSRDALNMRSWLAKGSVDRIITDPPWGLYAHIKTDEREFHARMLSEFAYVMSENAVAVVLTAKKDEFLEALTARSDFTLTERADCLINGKKACAFVLKRL